MISLDFCVHLEDGNQDTGSALRWQLWGLYRDTAGTHQAVTVPIHVPPAEQHSLTPVLKEVIFQIASPVATATENITTSKNWLWNHVIVFFSLNWSIKHMESLANSLITLSANIHLDELSKYETSPHHEVVEFLARSNQHIPLLWPQFSLLCLEPLWISWCSAFPFILFFGGHCLLFSKHIKMSRVFLMRQILVSSKNCFIILCYWEPPCLGFTLTCCLFQINSLDMLRKKWPVSNHLSGTKWRRLMLFSWNEEGMDVDIQVHLPAGGGGTTQVGAGYFYLTSKHVQIYVAQSTNVSWWVREGHGNPIM